GGGDHRLQVFDPPLERQLARLPIRHPAAALVPPEEMEVVGKEPDPMPPDRALPLILEVAQPVRGLDQAGARPRLGPGQLDAVARAQVPDLLAAGHCSQPLRPDSSGIGTEFPWWRG